MGILTLSSTCGSSPPPSALGKTPAGRREGRRELATALSQQEALWGGSCPTLGPQEGACSHQSWASFSLEVNSRAQSQALEKPRAWGSGHAGRILSQEKLFSELEWFSCSEMHQPILPGQDFHHHPISQPSRPSHLQTSDEEAIWLDYY